MKVARALSGTGIGIACLLALVFLVDLAIGIPFKRSSWLTDVLVVSSAGLLIWQGLENYREL